LGELYRGLEREYPIIAVLGIRRIGKTSLLRVFLNEVNGIYVDMRGVTKRSDLEVQITDSIRSNIGKLRRFIESLRGVQISGFSVEIKWRGKDSLSLSGLLSEVNKKKERFIVILDELQSTKPPLSAELRNTIAYAYDNLEYITLILAGSEIGGSALI
jgi:AAA+ ATPase superfamily predicted ATPase